MTDLTLPIIAITESAAAIAPGFVHYLPVATTILSAAFFAVLMRRYIKRGSGTHLLWWAAGIACYGLGTALESIITLGGNTIALTKMWYIAGALLGGYPLAQGTVYLLLRRKTAHILSAITLPFIVACSILVILSPVNADALLPHKPGGDVLGWQWVRAFTPLINGYAALFLIGGAILSAVRYAQQTTGGPRALGNASIAFGAILPGIGGAMAKGGVVEALYIGEFIGLIFIWIGYGLCVRSPRPLTNDAEPVATPDTTATRPATA